MEISCLGPLEVRDGPRSLPLGGPKQRLVLAHLLMRDNRTVPVDLLIAEVWDGDPPAAPRASLQSYISHLRRLLGTDRIAGDGRGYRLRIDVDEFDRMQFERLVTRGRELRAADPAQAATVLRQALDLWRGPPFADLSGTASLEAEITRLEELRTSTFEERIAADLASGRDAELIGELQHLLSQFPLRERLWIHLMTALYRAGRQGDALAAYDRARRVLVDELGVDPSPELQTHHRRVLQHDPGLQHEVVAGRTMAGVANPYKGLRAFAEHDANDFFGRETLVARLLARLRDGGDAGRFLAVVGPSGSGKSSVVRAGLIPALRAGALPASDTWPVVVMTPDTRPLDELASALRRVIDDPPADLAALLDNNALGDVLDACGHATGLLLVIDQFEGLYTLETDDDRRNRFVDVLVDAVSSDNAGVHIVVTLRADFVDRPLQHRGLADLLRSRTEFVTPMTPSELERAIAGPAERVGATVERALIAQIVADVSDQPSALPLLQYTLTELFDARTDGALTSTAYARLGGVTGALARRAEATYSSLSTEHRAVTRQLFLRLVTPGEGVDDTRRRTAVEDATAPAPERAGDVLARFGDARLLSFDRDPQTGAATVEVAHEALLHAWQRLRSWIDDARDDLRTQRQLEAAAADWDAADSETSFLATGVRLDRYEAWLAASGLTPSALARRFLDASLQHRAHIRAAEAARRDREHALERRSLRRLRVIVGVLAAAALVAGTLTVFVVVQSTRVARQAQIAAVRELASAADANLDADPELSMLLATEAVERADGLGDSPQRDAVQALHRAVTSSRIDGRIPDVGGTLDWHADGEMFVTEGPEESGIVDLRDVATGASVRSWQGHDIDVNDVAFSPDGALLATAGDDGAVRVWDPASGDRVAEFVDDDAGELWRPSFSADGSRLAVAVPTADMVRVFDIASGRTVLDQSRSGQPTATALDPSGERVAVGMWEPGGVAVLDVASGRELYVVADSGASTWDVSWSPDGRWLLTTHMGGVARVWDGRTGEPRATLSGHTASVTDADCSPDGAAVVTGSYDGTAAIWSIDDRGGAREQMRLAGRDMTDGIQGVAFAPDGRRVMTGDVGVAAVNVWDVSPTGDAEWTNLPADGRTPTPVAVIPGSGHIAVAGGQGAITIWEASTGEPVTEIIEHADPGITVEWLAAAPDGGMLAGTVNVDPSQRPTAVGQDAHRMVAWDVRDGRQLFTTTHDAEVTAVAWGADALASADMAGTIKVVDPSGRALATLTEGPDREVVRIAFSPDGDLLAATSFPLRGDARRVQIWNWRDRDVVATIDRWSEVIAFDPSGRYLIIGELDGRAGVWDTTSWEQVAAFEGHDGAVLAIAVSPDGSTVATAGTDGTVQLWGPATGAGQLTLTGLDGLVGSLAFSDDGTTLVSGGQEDHARVWALDIDDLVAIAADELTRGLTDAECRQYLHVESCAAS